MRILIAVLLLCPLAIAGDPPAEGGGLVLRIYDIRDLVESEADAEAIENAIVKSGASEMTLELAKDRGVLVIKATPAEHVKISALLTAARAAAATSRGRLVTIETRFLESTEPLSPGGGTGRLRLLDAEQAERLLRAVAKREDARILTAPRVNCYERQRAEVSVLEQLSYIADFEVKTGENGATAADPVIETARQGVTMSVKPIVSADGASVTLLIEATLCTVRRPIPTVRIEIPGGTVVEIQTPAITRTTWRRAATLPITGQALLDLGATPDGDGKRVAILVSVPAILREGFLREMGVQPGEEINLVPVDRDK